MRGVLRKNSSHDRELICMRNAELNPACKTPCRVSPPTTYMQRCIIRAAMPLQPADVRCRKPCRRTLQWVGSCRPGDVLPCHTIGPDLSSSGGKTRSFSDIQRITLEATLGLLCVDKVGSWCAKDKKKQPFLSFHLSWSGKFFALFFIRNRSIFFPKMFFQPVWSPRRFVFSMHDWMTDRHCFPTFS